MTSVSIATMEEKKEDERWCICHQCVYGFGIPFDVDGGGEVQVCGEICIVGCPTSADCGVPSTAVLNAASTVCTSLCCNICVCGVGVKISMSLKPCVSDDETISSDN